MKKKLNDLAAKVKMISTKASTKNLINKCSTLNGTEHFGETKITKLFSISTIF